MQLSLNFSLEEMIRSDVAVRHGISNQPGNKAKYNLRRLVVEILQPLRDIVGPVYVNSGYRSEVVNGLVGGRRSSQHILGQAADIESESLSNYELAVFIKNTFLFDQLVLEGYKLGHPRSGWVHVSYSDEKNRGEVLTAFVDKDGRFKYEKGLREK